MTAPTSTAGGLLGVTVKDTNPDFIISVAKKVFGNAGYTLSEVAYPTSLSFDKSAGAFGQAMWGGFNQTTSYRAKLRMVPVGRGNYRLAVNVSVVNDAGQAGFESGRTLIGLWNAEFYPLLQSIKSQAQGAGPGF